MGDPITRDKALELVGTDTPVFPNVGKLRHQPCLIRQVMRINRRNRVCVEYNGEQEWRDLSTISVMAGDLVFAAHARDTSDELMIRRERWPGERLSDYRIYINRKPTGDVYQRPTLAYARLEELGWDGSTNFGSMEAGA